MYSIGIHSLLYLAQYILDISVFQCRYSRWTSKQLRFCASHQKVVSLNQSGSSSICNQDVLSLVSLLPHLCIALYKIIFQINLIVHRVQVFRLQCSCCIFRLKSLNLSLSLCCLLTALSRSWIILSGYFNGISRFNLIQTAKSNHVKHAGPNDFPCDNR